ncbi:nickel/cobalt transporter [Tabrizicola sp.]|uniref:nickel/cobalt transporter n=1 Tax=Tabrizicola sp. TaxID=2005166 RepID=UPI0035B1CC67
MRRALGLAGLALVLVLGALWLSGALGPVADGFQSAQRAAQERLAGAIRALRGGEPGALAAFWLVCFGYGVLHAAGPGHGKLVIGGYGVARRVPVGRLAGLALASSLAQAAVAVGLVYAALAVLGLTRTAVEGAAEDWVTPVGHAMILGLGLWLVWRGLAGMRAEAAARGHEHGHGPDHHHDHHHHDHHHHHHGHVHGPQCTHAHGPSVEEVERVGSFRDGLALVAGIAMRPCSGALFVLVLTWQLGIALAGVAGAFVMGLGTALVTVGAALVAVWAREGALSSLGSGAVARAMPVAQLVIGAVIAVAAGGLLVQSL